jgi:enterochelin esterase-like enzyme
LSKGFFSVLLLCYMWTASACANENISSAPLNEQSKIENVSLMSGALGRETSFSAYLPPGYDRSKHYPVLYMLYGYGGNQTSWFDAALDLGTKADRLIRAGKIVPLIIVSPNYGNSFGVNSEPGRSKNPGGVSEGKYADYLARELTAYIDGHYGTIASREGRFIGGASMGGFAALHLGFTYPELYGKVGGHSSALWDYTASDQFAEQRNWLYPDEASRKLRDPFVLAESRDLSGVQVYLDCGNEDRLAEKSEKLHNLLLQKGVRSELHIYPGIHQISYWSDHLEDYLFFYAGDRS